MRDICQYISHKIYTYTYVNIYKRVYIHRYVLISIYFNLLALNTLYAIMLTRNAPENTKAMAK